MFNVDKGTLNKTFLNLFYELQDEGLTYNASSSILCTKNSKLLSFDFNNIPDIDKITGYNYSKIILSEIINNIWFYFREIIRIPIPGQPIKYNNALQFPINKISYQMVWCYRNNISFFVIYDENTKYIVNTTMELLALYDLIINYNKTPIMHILTSDVNKYNSIIDNFKLLSMINSDPIPKLLINNFEDSILKKSVNQKLTNGENFENIDRNPLLYAGNYFGINIFSNPNIILILTELKKRKYQISFEGYKSDLLNSEIGRYIMVSSPIMDNEFINKTEDDNATNNYLKNNLVIIDATNK